MTGGAGAGGQLLAPFVFHLGAHHSIEYIAVHNTSNSQYSTTLAVRLTTR